MVDAAIEYELIYTAPEIVYDGFAPLKEHFMHQQKKADEYFEKSNLQELVRLFEKLTAKLKFKAELKFVAFIAEKSSVDFNPFDGLEDKANRILKNGKIQNEEERKSADLQLDIYKQTDPESKKIQLLNDLICYYYATEPPKENETTWSKVLKREKVGDGRELVSVVSGTGPKPLMYEDERIKSPDDKRVVSITQHSIDGKTGVTMIQVILTRTSLPIYQLNELNGNIQAYWKDNNTIVIQIPGNVNAVVQYKTVQSFDDVIKIEYK